MKISELIKLIEGEVYGLKGNDFKLKGISCDSRNVKEGYLFVAIKGEKKDGHDYINQAIANGAKVLIYEKQRTVFKNKKDIVFLKVPDARTALAKAACGFYNTKASFQDITGITGTNGKTTICYLIEDILKNNNLDCAVLGTVNYRFKEKKFMATNTTPGPIELHKFLSKASKEKIKHIVMEVSSHALSQERVSGIDFSSAIFTNLTSEHLDYHGTLENYFQAKLKLFLNIRPDGFALVNSDDRYSEKIKKKIFCRIVTYGVKKKSDFQAKNIKTDISGSRFSLLAKKCKINVKTKLIGKHNIYNILAAIAWSCEKGFPLKKTIDAVSKFESVPGRLERIRSKSKKIIFVDYAHTDDALEKVLLSLQGISKGRIISVFGCGGERDRIKRPKMGRAASELSDFAIITNDNPRSEDPDLIIKEIVSGIRRKNYSIEPDRKKAIESAIFLARKNDIVLIAGKGHENYQQFKNKRVHFDDREVAEQCLQSKS